MPEGEILPVSQPAISSERPSPIATPDQQSSLSTLPASLRRLRELTEGVDDAAGMAWKELRRLEGQTGEDLTYHSISPEKIAETVGDRLDPFLSVQNEARKAQTKEALRIAAGLVGEIPQFPKLDTLRVPGRYNTPSCLERPDLLPRPYDHLEGTKAHNTAFVPWLPDRVDRGHFNKPENLTPVELSYDDQRVRSLIEPYLRGIGLSFDSWLNWVLSKRIVGIDLKAQGERKDAVYWVIGRSAETIKGLYLSTPEAEDAAGKIKIPSPSDLFEMETRIRERCGKYDTSGDISEAFKLLAWRRYVREQGIKIYEEHESIVGGSALSRDYLLLLQVMEYGYPLGSRPQFKDFRIFQSYTNLLIGGGPQDQYYSGSFFAETDEAMAFDYFDIFMLTAAEAEMSPDRLVTYEHAYPKTQSVHSNRCVYGDHDNTLIHQHDLLMIMATNYFRMSDWQKEVYREEINRAFSRQADLAGRSWGRLGGLAVSATNSPQKHKFGQFTSADIFPQQETFQKLATAVVGDLSRGGRIQSESRAYSVNDRSQVAVGSLPITGHEADQFEVDPGGYLVYKPGREREEAASIPLRLTARERLGTTNREALQTIQEVMRDPEAGKLPALSSCVNVFEAILGRRPKSRQLFDLLTWLGTVNSQTNVIREAPRSQVEAAISSCFENPSFANSDELSKLMTIYAILGFLPKELVVERVLSSFQAIAEIFPVQMALELERVTKDDLESQGIDASSYTAPVFSARDEVAAAKKDYPANSRRLNSVITRGLSQVLGWFSQHSSYDHSSDHILSSLLTLRGTGTLHSQCLVQAETLAGFANLVTGRNPPINVSYRDPEPDLSLEKWYEKVELGQVVPFDHYLAQFQSRVGRFERTFIMDQTSAHLLLVAGRNTHPDERRSEQLRVSQVVRYDSLRRPGFQDRVPGWEAIVYGNRAGRETSSLLAEMASGFPSLDSYRKVFNPDDLNCLRKISFDSSYPINERLDAFHRLLIVAPRNLAYFQPELNHVRRFVDNLESLISLSINYGDYLPAYFLANILSRHGAVPQNIQALGESFKTSVIGQLASYEKRRLLPLLKYYRHLLTTSDIKEIMTGWARYQTELGKAREQQKESEFRNKQAEQTREQMETEIGRINKTSQETTFSDETAEHQENQPERVGTKARKAVQLADAIEQRETDMLNLGPDQVDAEGTDLIPIVSSSSENALNGILEELPEPARRRLASLLGLVLLKSEQGYLGGNRAVIEQAWKRLEDLSQRTGLPFQGRGEIAAGSLRIAGQSPASISALLQASFEEPTNN